MTDTTLTTATADAPKRRSLSVLRLAELQGLASSMGISGTSGMRKGDLIEAIKARQTSSGADAAAPRTRTTRRAGAPTDGDGAGSRIASTQAAVEAAQAESAPAAARDERPASRAGAQSRDETRADAVPARREDTQPSAQSDSQDGGAGEAQGEGRSRRSRRDRRRGGDDRAQGDQQGQQERQQDRQQGQQDRQQDRQQGQQDRQQDRQQGQQDRQQGQQDRQQSNRRDDNRRDDNRRDDDDGYGGRRRNRQRNRDRKRRGQRGLGEDYSADVETVSDDDVLVPVAGLLDVLDTYAFVRTSGYLPGPNDVYVPLGLVKRYGLRKGDAVTGAVKALREGEQPPARQKFNALVRLDTVNGKDPEESRGRVEFQKLTPLYPQQRLRLETDPTKLTTRMIDLVSPIGKGQRGLIVSPPKAGKTMVMQAIANAITTNNPEAHLMVVLVDERPEEVTDFERSVKGEVIASTFDRPASDHTAVAELAIERAKRLVEMGHDVVVLLDGITRLGRAYNLAAPASGRILSGGVDSSALYPPKKFFGAARNIENGGSLTILATALVETGSKMDEVIFEEFKGTGNMELRLSRQLADRRIFPAIDATSSGTRREEILMGGEELKVMWKLRRVLSALDQQQATELLIDRLKKTKSNVEFLMMVQKTSNIHLDDD